MKLSNLTLEDLERLLDKSCDDLLCSHEFPEINEEFYQDRTKIEKAIDNLMKLEQ